MSLNNPNEEQAPQPTQEQIEQEQARSKKTKAANSYCSSCLRRAGYQCRITHKDIAQSVEDCQRAGWRDLGAAAQSMQSINLRFAAERLFKTDASEIESKIDGD